MSRVGPETEWNQQAQEQFYARESALLLAELLDETRAFFRRYVVVDDVQADAVALWVSHTYVFDLARATPYLHFWSPEYGSGKTTALEVLEVLTRSAVVIDSISGAALFRLIDAEHTTVLLDEVDGVFGKKGSETAEDHRTLLNSGYRKGKVAIRCGGRNNTELHRFNVFCPKALAGLNELPGTLAHRSIPIAMKPPRPEDLHQDFDSEDVEQEAERLRERLDSWAADCVVHLRDPHLKPAKLPELDARRNEIWRILFRIADLAGERWAEAARAAARALSSGDRRKDEASLGVKLLTDIHAVFDETVAEKITCPALAAALNELEESPWGGWSDGRGITTRELGRKLIPYGVRAKPIRIDGERAGNGYEREQFEDAWSRYLSDSAISTSTSSTSGSQSQKPAEIVPVQTGPVPVAENGAIPHGERVVPVVPVEKPEVRTNEPSLLLSEAQISELGTIPLDEIRHRHDQGEL